MIEAGSMFMSDRLSLAENDESKVMPAIAKLLKSSSPSSDVRTTYAITAAYELVLQVGAGNHD